MTAPSREQFNAALSRISQASSMLTEIRAAPGTVGEEKNVLAIVIDHLGLALEAAHDIDED